jgi:hypothetical protein
MSTALQYYIILFFVMHRRNIGQNTKILLKYEIFYRKNSLDVIR